ncbi:8-oxo-dGTP pyrophosphatase MutT (NUDIX family) [Kineosphaera limosa]|uniref:Putative hydrolase n=1 Tax=Kineosphaera limosa NBRC 100340 TaxID=1184609 RepID=K6WZL6_9MICO|nr:NUDIX domain-containing protein [Kineosphaera limosa]NYE00462.1 8-oxo-dGTP pyrophosphatase MutT (NUDIX family) [Kineosphaera limosa]GAB97562.1 putative hydrolase [Kineosphaera limosa NBRC 100340]
MGARELVDLYDDHGRVVGQATRAQVRGQNLQHAATAVLVRNQRGELFVHRRTDTKDVYPGLFDVAAGGVVEAGEDPAQAAAREAFEELGVHGVPLLPLGVAHYADEHTRYLAFCFEVVYDGPIRLQPEEVAWGAWLPVAEALAWLTDDEHPFVPDTTALLLDHLRRAVAGQEVVEG